MSDTTPHPDRSQPELLSPLVPTDPPRIGPYWLDSRLLAGPAGITYLAHRDTTRETGGDHPDQVPAGVMIVRLAEGAAADAAARDRFAGLVNKLHIDTVLARGGQGQDGGRWGRKFLPEVGPAAIDDLDEAPWVALAYEGSPRDRALADHLLSEVELRSLAAQGSPAGPDYRHYWLSRVRPGLAKIWPLPWPGRRDRAGWQTVLISWLLMLLLAALAVMIAILLFKDQPPMSPPQPVPQSASGSPSPQSGSPSESPQSGTPSSSPSQSGSGSPTASPSPTDGSGSPSTASASPSPSGTESGGGQQSPRSRL